jgi:hypothetical protein
MTIVPFCSMNRRTFLRTTLAATAGVPFISRPCLAADPAVAVEQAHAEIWRRFIDKHGVMLDFTDLNGSVSLPTPEECREGKPNALGWWAPIENGAMFNGLYMDAAVNRWRHTKSPADAAKARRLAEGLLFLNSISDVKGFVGRGVSTDGKSHYPMGSNDQTMPWYYGLWRYLDSGLATKEERERIVAKLSETTDAIVSLNWAMPAEAPFGKRGSFAGFTFETAPRQLFVMKLMHAVTGDAKWDALYREALHQRGGKDNMSKLELCERGMVFDYARTHNWTACTAVAAIRGLWEIERDAVLKTAFAKGLKASAALAAESLPLAAQFDHDDKTTFNPDWRASMLPLWKPQRTEQQAQDLAHLQLREFLKASPRRAKETAFIREPTSASWIVTLCPDATVVQKHVPEIERIIAHFDYSKLYYSTFFWVDSAWWRLKDFN